MKVVLLLSTILTLAAFNGNLESLASDGPTSSGPGMQNVAATSDGSLIDVLDFKCLKSRQVVTDPPVTETGPARAVIPQNKNYQRNARINDPAGTRDPNEDTIDGRSAALEKISQEARQPQHKPVDGYAYRMKVQNSSPRVVEILFLEYQFIDAANPTSLTRRQFLCGVNIKPSKGKDVQAFSLAGPPEVVNVNELGNKAENPLKERVIVNRVEYADGTMWQRKDWNFAEIGMAYRRAVSTPWGSEMCRGL